jgi:hypothetical protein
LSDNPALAGAVVKLKEPKLKGAPEKSNEMKIPLLLAILVAVTVLTPVATGEPRLKQLDV